MIHRPRLVTHSIVRRIRSALAGRSAVEGAETDDGSVAPGDGSGKSTDDNSALETEAQRVRYNPNEADFEVVIDALDSDDPESRRLAAEVLAGVPASSRDEVTDAVPALVRRLDDDRLSTRRHSAKALALIAPVAPDRIRDEAPALVDHLSAHNLRVSANVAAALADAADSYPGEIAPLVFPYGDPEVPSKTRRNAFTILERAARASPESVEPIVPTMIELLDRRAADRGALCRTVAPISDAYPDALAPAVPSLVSYVERHDDEGREAAVEALARLAVAEPSTGRPAIPALIDYLVAPDPNHADLVAKAVVEVVDRYPAERDHVLDELAVTEGLDRFDAARRLAETDRTVGVEIAKTTLEGSPLRRYLDR